MLSKVEYGQKGIEFDNIPISSTCYYTVSLEKTFFTHRNVDQYFVKIYRTDTASNCHHENMGYIYFYLDPETRTSSYIGTYVKPEYRSLGLASLLTSYWIKICLDEGYDFLTTNKAQRKPYLLYILKKSFFEIDDTEKYDQSKHTIHICQAGGAQRFLLFKSDEIARIFQSGKIYRGDDYRIMLFEDLDASIVLDRGETVTSDQIQELLERSKGKVQLLDRVLLSNIYTLRDNNAAYDLSTRRIDAKDEIQYRSRR